MRKIDFGNGPHSIIITGQLHFTEIDSITSLYQNVDPPLIIPYYFNTLQ